MLLLIVNKAMDEKDKRIKELEKELKELRQREKQREEEQRRKDKETMQLAKTIAAEVGVLKKEATTSMRLLDAFSSYVAGK